VDHLNRTAPGEPVAFFGSDPIAGLEAQAYSANWHSDAFWRKVRDAPGPAAASAIFREMGIRYVVAPAGGDPSYPSLRVFFTRWVDAEGARAGGLSLYRVRDSASPVVVDTRPLAPGVYDDREPRIELDGSWFADNQFSETAGHTVSYSNIPGDLLRV